MRVGSPFSIGYFQTDDWFRSLWCPRWSIFGGFLDLWFMRKWRDPRGVDGKIMITSVKALFWYRPSQNPDCLLCPRSTNEEKRRKPYPSADNFLRACKPTEGQGWAHVLCAVFTPELTFTDASRLRLVEGLNAVARHKWTAVCFMPLITLMLTETNYRDVLYAVKETAR